MRLVIDLQGAQGSSHERGIGRYSRELAMAMARAPRDHEVVVALSGAFPDVGSKLADAFSAILPREQIRLWHPPPGVSFFAHSPNRGIAEHLRAQFLASLRPDLIHVSSIFEGLGDDVVTRWPGALQRLPVVGTCYDLIPLILRETYFGPKGIISSGQNWYYGCLQEMSLSTGLLAISESSRQEAIQHLGYPPERVFNIRAGIHGDFRPASLDAKEREALLHRYGLRGDFILFLGAGDIRKNEAGLISAYALLPPDLQARYQLLIVGKMDPGTLHKVAAEHDIPEERFVIARFVEEGDLSALYTACSLFVFPSLHEGFGLPAAEAMACGAPVIASNTTSLPEVVGRADALFDPTQPAEIAARMREVLDNPSLRQSLVAHGREQARKFTWQASAELAWDALEQIALLRREEELATTRHTVLRPRPSLAFVSPLPPQATGIADYSRDLIPSLARHYDITLVTESAPVDDPRLAGSFPVIDPATFAAGADRFDRILYQIGNSEFHRFQLQDLLPAIPGVVTLHDAFLSNAMHAFAHRKGKPESFREDLHASHGYHAVEVYEADGDQVALGAFPCSLPVLESAIWLVQHSRHAQDVLTRYFGEAVTDKTSIIPHLRAFRPRPGRAPARRKLGLAEDAFVICSFGIVAATKLPERLISAWQRMGGDPGMLVFAGLLADDAAHLAEASDPGAVANRPRFLGRIDEDTYDLWLAASDVAVQLRSRSRGESSGAIADCLAAGLPLIVNAHGSSAELPDGSVIKLPDMFRDEELTAALMSLRDDPGRRDALARAGRAYAAGVLGAEAIAAQYHAVIEKAYAASPASAIAQMGHSLVHRPSLSQEALTDVARATARTLTRPLLRRVFLELSGWTPERPSYGSGRATEELCRRLLRQDMSRARGEAVRFLDGRLHHAPDIASALLGTKPLPDRQKLADAGEGDVLFCAVPHAGMTHAELREIQRLRLSGVQVIVLVHDSLPLRRPESLGADALPVADWYARLLTVADGAVCWSPVTVQNLDCWLDDGQILRNRPLPMASLRAGSDYSGTLPMELGGTEEGAYLAAIRSAAQRPTLLMNGPFAKWDGVDQAIKAMELLWSEGHDIALTLVGPLGKGMDHVATTLSQHRESGYRLHWIRRLAETHQRQLRMVCSALLVTSESEARAPFVDEALQVGLPVIARRLTDNDVTPRTGVTLYDAAVSTDLSDAMKRVVGQAVVKASCQAGRGPAWGWDDGIGQLLDAVLRGQWPDRWRPAGASPAQSVDGDTALMEG
ncbi:glycosyltransferase [Roseomonas gilardii]|uniref:glycosyltransferase n=1 Tax=Roseomonas gilardii TaxID=257708 RepID=UPI0004823BFF|nr:glycosyltransferase [Roseomonas gilardii]SUE62994.1 D-inositol-3-phosphate glycosyltransferase [Roseomonas gilardii subsp. rosea]